MFQAEIKSLLQLGRPIYRNEELRHVRDSRKLGRVVFRHLVSMMDLALVLCDFASRSPLKLAKITGLGSIEGEPEKREDTKKRDKKEKEGHRGLSEQVRHLVFQEE